MLKSEPMGVGSGSGGELETGHVICPACAHNFAAIPQNAQERIAELEAALRRLVDMIISDDESVPGTEDIDDARALLRKS